VGVKARFFAHISINEGNVRRLSRHPIHWGYKLQVYHMCTGRGRSSGRQPFLCPESTKFNQKMLVCDHATKVKCAEAGEYFHRNLLLHNESLRATERARLNKNKSRQEDFANKGESNLELCHH